MVARRSANFSARCRSCVTITMVMPMRWLNFAQQREDGFAGGRIEISGGLIGEKNFRAIHQRARDGGALLFAAGEFARAVADAFAEAHTFERFAHAGGAFGAIHFGQPQRQLDIFFQRHARQQIEGLKNHADGVAAVARQFERRKFGQIAAAREDGARGGPVQPSHQIEQRGFAGAGTAEQREEFSGGHGRAKHRPRRGWRLRPWRSAGETWLISMAG